MAARENSVNFDSFVNIVNGQNDHTGEVVQGIDPSTGEKLWPVPCATESILNHAVTSAQVAFRKWSNNSVDERQNVLSKMRDKLASCREQMTALLMKEVGRPVINADLRSLKQHTDSQALA